MRILLGCLIFFTAISTFSGPKGDLEGYEGTDYACTVPCATIGLNTLCQISSLKNIVAEAKNMNSHIKSEREVKEYMADYRGNCDDKVFGNFLDEYDQYIKTASKQFQIPYAYLACLLFKENQFFENRTSDAGAVGIAQFMPNNIDYMSDILKTYIGTTWDKAKLFDQINKWEAVLHQGKNLDSSVYIIQFRKNAELAKTRLAYLDLAEGWKSYIDAVRKTEAFNERYSDNGRVVEVKTRNGKGQILWREEYPTIFNRPRALAPVLAIGAAALYSNHIIKLIQEAVGKKELNGKDQLISLLTLTAASYNVGHGAIPNAIEKEIKKSGNRNLTLKIITNRIYDEAVPETKKHMESIKRCMQKGNENAPLQIGEKGKLEDQVKCAKPYTF